MGHGVHDEDTPLPEVEPLSILIVVALAIHLNSKTESFKEVEVEAELLDVHKCRLKVVSRNCLP